MALTSFSRKFIGGGLSSEGRKETLEELFVFGKENQRPFFRRMAVLTMVSTVIATGGLLSGSAAVVIGAMLVAPLMCPVMSAAATITMGWLLSVRSSWPPPKNLVENEVVDNQVRCHGRDAACRMAVVKNSIQRCRLD